MAIPFPALLVLLGTGAALVARKKREFAANLPVQHIEGATWIRGRMAKDQAGDEPDGTEYLCLGPLPNQTVDILNNQAYVQAHQASSLVRKGDFITVSVSQMGYDKQRHQDPFFGYPAIYVVAHSRNDGSLVKSDGRKLLLDANIISGHGPKNWKIWSAKRNGDAAPTAASSIVATGNDGAPIFPEIMTIERKGNGRIFTNVLAERNGGYEWCLNGREGVGPLRHLKPEWG